MIVQIYAATSVEVALELVDLGVDTVGFIAGDYGEVHAELTFEEARAIVEAVRGKASASALTMSTDVDEILRMAEAVTPNIVHISSDVEAVGVDAMWTLRNALPPQVALMKAIHVGGSESVQIAKRFTPMCEILLLDTKVTGMPGVGATGVVHDWQVSREIVRAVGTEVQVILAGGLTAENVATAIEIVQPHGVDSNTGTNIDGDPVVKDMDKVRAFVHAARGT